MTMMAGWPQTTLSKRWVVFLLLLSLCQKIFAVDERSMLRDPSPWERALQENQECLDKLNSVSDDGEVDGGEFLLFLHVTSGGNLKFDDFHDVPLDLRLVFYAAACSGGKGCTSGTPTISLNPLGLSTTLLQIFCAQISNIVDKLDTMKIAFRYVLHYKNSLTPAEILARADGNDIVSDLETATERMVRNALGCPEGWKGTRGVEKRSSSVDLHVYPLHGDKSRLLFRRLLNEETQKDSFPRSAVVKVAGLRQMQECNYTVVANIDELYAYNCDSLPSSTDVKCALVESSVTLTALTADDELTNKERSALRRQVMTKLSNSIDDGSFMDQLP